MLARAILSFSALLIDPQPYDGRANRIEVRSPRIDANVSVDGKLDEAVWKQAARLTGFSRYSPSDDQAADDSTEVFVWYSPTAMHVGVRAYASPGTVRATLADRDKIFNDDYIGIFLGTFNDRRQATVFAANPYGIQGDGILVEQGSSSSGFGGLSVGREATDVRPDYVFQSKGRLTEDGYEIELRIPFKSLTYQPGEHQSWSLNVIRRVQSRGYEYSWVPARRAAVSYIAQHGHLVDLNGLQRGMVLDVSPIVTAHANGSARPSSGPPGYHYVNERPQLGANIKWGVSPNLTVNGTVRPDFAEVESDAGQFVSDPRQSLFFPEKRPFFLEGLENFSTPSNLVYTRRIVSPVGATKVTGKIAGTAFALLTAIDDTVNSVSLSRRPVFNILRARRDVGTSTRLGIIATDKEDGANSNRVIGADARVLFSKSISANLQGVIGRTVREGTPTLVGGLWAASLARSGRRFSSRYVLSGISDDFRTSAGFISRPAIAHALADHSVTWYGVTGALVENVSADIVLDEVWQYSHFVRRGDAIEKKLHLNTNYQLRGGWRVGASLLLETFGFDQAYYSRYYIERHRGAVIDTVPFVGLPRIPNRDYVLSVSTPQFKRFAMSVESLWGQDENFYEWAPANIGIHTATVSWTPTQKARVAGTYTYQYFNRRTDGSRVGDGHNPRIKAEYQLNRSMFLRVVGQYLSNFQDELRDDSHSGDPILLRSGTRFSKATEIRSNSLRGDWLFSYLPSPGKVIYLGYGSTLDDEGPFRFRHLSRTQDGFFAKASYVFRR